MVIDATIPLMVTSSLLFAATVSSWAVDRALSGRADRRRRPAAPVEAPPPTDVRLCRRVELFDDLTAVA